MNNELEKKKLGYDLGLAEGLVHGEENGYERGLDAGRSERVTAYEVASKDAFDLGYKNGLAAGAGSYKETFIKGYEAGKKAALREQQGLKGAVEIGNELDTEAWGRILNDVGRAVTMQPGPSLDADSLIPQYGFPTFGDLTGQTKECDGTHELQLIGRTKWNTWPLMLRHDYVQARLHCGVPTVQIVVNGNQCGLVLPDGKLRHDSIGLASLFDRLAMRVAKYDANCDKTMNVRIPDGRVGLFLFIDSKGNEFELKNTEYGTVIVKGDLVLGVVSSMTVIEHTHGALQQCEEYGKLTQAVFAFCKWARNIDHRALPRFMVRKVAIEGQRGFSVRADDRGRFEVLDITGTVGVILNPHINGTFGVLSIDAPIEPRTRDIVEAATRTVRSKFYGNMAL